MICWPVRFGKALASKATEPLMIGAEKEVPDQKNDAPVWSGATTRTPSAVR